MIIKDILKYFAQFVPVAALNGIFHSSTGTAYDTLMNEMLSASSLRRIADIRDYIFGLDAESIRKRITSVTGVFLFVDYSTIESSINPVCDRKDDIFHVAVTVAVPHPDDQDQVAEALSQDLCLSIISQIRAAMRDDQDTVSGVKWVKWPATMRPFVAKELANAMGWTMEFDVAGVDIA